MNSWNDLCVFLSDWYDIIPTL